MLTIKENTPQCALENLQFLSSKDVKLDPLRLELGEYRSGNKRYIYALQRRCMQLEIFKCNLGDFEDMDIIPLDKVETTSEMISLAESLFLNYK